MSEPMSEPMHPRVCPNGLDCPCYDQPWVNPAPAPRIQTEEAE